MNNIELKHRPLIVCDVDEVALEFLSPFQSFLNSQSLELVPKSFRLHGNIVHQENGNIAQSDHVDALIDDFFADQLNWQYPADDASHILGDLSQYADVIFLTAMPPNHYDVRRELLNQHNMPYPLIASEEAKGPYLKHIHQSRDLPLIFIDDMVYNHKSALDHVPDALLINVMANHTFRAIAPPNPDGVQIARDWHHIKTLIDDYINP